MIGSLLHQQKQVGGSRGYKELEGKERTLFLVHSRLCSGEVYSMALRIKRGLTPIMLASVAAGSFLAGVHLVLANSFVFATRIRERDRENERWWGSGFR